ncbi:MAG: hypothetical protein R3B45_08915 [Bdellovibrionota bacterium]
MNEFIKIILKMALQMVVWVFILSISWSGRTLFDRAHELLIRNSIVEAVDSELANVWYKVKETAKLTFSDNDDGGSTEAM